MKVYGKDFAAIYNKQWAFWGPKMWPFLLKYVKKHVPKAQSWLDLCCGTGSLLKFVCKNGFSATGVDISKYQLQYARRNAPGAKLLVQDVRKLSLPQKFDVITCMFDSLNYLTTKRDLLKVFRRVRQHMMPDGLFAFDMNTFKGLQDHWCRTSATYERDLTLVVESSFNPKRALGCCRITGFTKKGKLYQKFQEEHIERGYRPQEIEELLEKVGFFSKKYDGNKLIRPSKKSGRLLYLCTIR